MTARAGGAPYLRSFVTAHPEIKLKPFRQIGAIAVWLVAGKVVRDHVFIDFTEGGNSNAYAWMPPNEIWLDTDVNPAEQKFTLLHELREYNRMAEGVGYEAAHAYANLAEKKARDAPSLYPKLLQDEINKHLRQVMKGQPDIDSRRRRK